MSAPGRLLRQVLHTQPSQLAWRALSVVRRGLHEVAPQLAIPLRRTSDLLPRALGPRTVFAPRVHLVDTATNGCYAQLLGERVRLDPAPDWSGAGRSALQRFHLHYMEYLESVSDERFVALVLDWIDRNPLTRRGAWRTAWSSYVISLRTVVWMQQLVERRASLRGSTVERIERSLVEQLAYLAAHLERDIRGNHLIKNAKALLWASRYFEGRTAQAWGSVAARVLRRELRDQILPDGMHFERSPSYHAQVFADLVECAAVAQGALRATLLAHLEPMAQVLVDLSHPDGLPCLFNDAGLHTTYSPDECLRAWGSVSGGRASRRAVFALPASGYYGVRSEDMLFVADCGEIGPKNLPAHAHGDVLSFEWSLGGRRFVVDPGVFEYEAGLLRDEARATRSHSTLTVSGLDQAEFSASFRVGRKPKVRRLRYEAHSSGFVLEGEHDGYSHLAGSPRHRRRFIASAGSLVIEDEVLGGRGQRVRSSLLLHPDVSVIVADGRLAMLRCDGIEVLVDSRSRMRVEAASWSPDLGVRIATHRLVFEHPDAPCRSTTRLQRLVAGELALDRAADVASNAA